MAGFVARSDYGGKRAYIRGKGFSLCQAPWPGQSVD
jgi:hypothetical protein